MRRRRFLQMAAGAAASAVVSPAFASQLTLRIASVVRDSVPAIVVLPGTAPVTDSHSLLSVSGCIDADDVIHVMMEEPVHGSYPEIEFPQLQLGRRYRMRLMNATRSEVPVFLPQRVELARVAQAPVAGVFTDTIWVGRYGVVEAVVAF
jgi:hypothetical protein